MDQRPPGSGERIRDLLDRLALYVRSRQHAGGLNPVQWEALRYLTHANRYSRNPTALTTFLGATKGTVSQTLLALERKRLVSRQADPKDRRSVRLVVTATGEQRLRHDPLSDVAMAAAALPRSQREDLAAGLAALLLTLQRKAGGRAFGICEGCRFFRRHDAPAEAGGPHRCGLTREPLADRETRQICAEQQPRAA